jgi:ABC-type polysaccharide transport system permease subunit
MKKAIIIILSIICIGLLLKLITTNKYDVNRDGKVNSKDLLDLRVYLINKGE